MLLSHALHGCWLDDLISSIDCCVDAGYIGRPRLPSRRRVLLFSIWFGFHMRLAVVVLRVKAGWQHDFSFLKKGWRGARHILPSLKKLLQELTKLVRTGRGHDPIQPDRSYNIPSCPSITSWAENTSWGKWRTKMRNLEDKHNASNILDVCTFVRGCGR